MKTRKLVLIIADVVLLAVCIIQWCMRAHDGAKYFKISETPDEYTVVTPAENIHLTLEGENWIMNGKYPVSTTSAQNFADAVENIRALDKVATVNEATNIKYELVDGKKISVEIRKGGKLLRSLEIGKDATSGSQTYVTIDGGKDIYLAAGNLRTTFDKSISALRDRYVWGNGIEKKDLSSASITDEEGKTWSLSRMGSGTDIVWNLTGEGTEGLEVDSEKAMNWLESLGIMTTSNWYDDSVTAESLGGVLAAKAKIGYGFNTLTLDLYKLPAEEGAEEKYYAVSSATPFVFEVPAYQATKYLKEPSELAK